MRATSKHRASRKTLPQPAPQESSEHWLSRCYRRMFGTARPNVCICNGAAVTQDMRPDAFMRIGDQ